MSTVGSSLKRVLAAFRNVGEILLRTVLFLVVFAALGALFIIPVSPVLAQWEETSRIGAKLYADGVGALAIILATWLMLRFVDRRSFRSIGLAPGSAVRHLGFGIPAGAAWLLAPLTALWLAGLAGLQPAGAFSVPALAGAATAIFLNVLTQQLLLCGFIFQTIQARSNSAVAVLVSAALFALYHLGAYQGALLPALNVFLAGLLFCLTFRLSGTLWLPIGIHFAWNLLLGPVLGLTVSGTSELGVGWTVISVEGPTIYTGGAFGLEGSLLVTIATAIACASCYAAIRRQGLPSHTPILGAAA